MELRLKLPRLITSEPYRLSTHIYIYKSIEGVGRWYSVSGVGKMGRYFAVQCNSEKNSINFKIACRCSPDILL